MATPTLTTTNFTRIDDCDDDTGWSGKPAENGDIFVQGAGSLALKVDNTTDEFGYDIGTTTPLDFANEGSECGDHIFFWVNILQPDLINEMSLRLANTSQGTMPAPGNSIEYEIFTVNDYAGGWFRACQDPRQKPTTLNGTGTHINVIGDVRWVIFYFDMGNIAGNAVNCIIDAVDVGTGLIVTGGSTTDKITWDDIYTTASSTTNAYGLIEKRSGVYFLLGEWQFGDASNNCYFDDEDQIAIWEGRLGDNGETTGNIVSAMAPELNKLIVVEGTGTTDFISGNKVGTGNDAEGSNGIIYQAAPAEDSSVVNNLTLDFSDADLTNIELFGCTFRRVVGSPFDDSSITFCSDATNGPNHEVSGCLFDQCGLVDLGRVSAQNLEFSSTGQSSKFGVPFDKVFYWDDSASTWYDGTITITNREGLGWQPVGSGSVVNNDEVYWGFRDEWTGLSYVSGGLGDNSNDNWEYYDGTTWSTLTMGGSEAGLASASKWEGSHVRTFSPPGDWAMTTVNASASMFFIRLRLSADDTASGTDHNEHFWFHAQTPVNGAALLWNENIDLVNANFVNNKDSDTNEKAHGTEHRASGTDAYTTWTFSDNDADILFSAPSGNLTIDANSGSDPTTYTIVGSGSVTINTNVTVTLTGLIGTPATEVRVYDTGTTTELTGQENVTTGSFDINLDATDFVDIRIHNIEYEYLAIINFDMPATDASIPIQQRFDRNYLNP